MIYNICILISMNLKNHISKYFFYTESYFILYNIINGVKIKIGAEKKI